MQAGAGASACRLSIDSWLGSEPAADMVQTSHPLGVQLGLAGRTFASPGWPRARHNLASSYTSFIGREREAAELDRLLSGPRLLTLTGTPGVGKTRLALEVASQRLDAHPGGVWWV